MASMFPDANAASEALSGLLEGYWGRRAMEELLTEFLSRLAEEHQMYLCEPTMIDAEFDYLDYFRRTRTLTEEEKKAQVDGWGRFAHPRVETKDCIECGWPAETHLWADYMCCSCRAKEELFGEPNPEQGPSSSAGHVDDRQYTIWLEMHDRYGSLESHHRWEIMAREPDPDERMEIAGRPLSLLAFEFLEHKRHASSPRDPAQEEIPDQLVDHHQDTGDRNVQSRLDGGGDSADNAGPGRDDIFLAP